MKKQTKFLWDYFSIHLPDWLYLEIVFYYNFHHFFSMKNPKSFNEKLQWLKLYDRNPIYTKMVDKYEVREYIAEIIGEKYLIPLLGVWNSVDEIDFNTLPNQFVIKCTHDSGSTIICKDKNTFDYENARDILNRNLKENYYYKGREWPYKKVKPKIIAEQYLYDGNSQLNDYKIMCFNGEPKFSFVCSERDTSLKVTFFDLEWNVMDFERHYPKSEKKIKKPVLYDQMIQLARLLSHNIPFVRVDFYEVNGKIYFGELTFYPGGGFEEFSPEEWDYKLGNLITLPKGGSLNENTNWG